MARMTDVVLPQRMYNPPPSGREAVIKSAASAASPEGFQAVIQSAASAASPAAKKIVKKTRKNCLFGPFI